MRNTQRKFMLAGLALSLLAGGCAAVVGGAVAGTGLAYHMGALRSTFPANQPAVMTASREALRDLGYSIISDEPTEIEARTPDDTKVKVSTKQAGEGVTDISIRVGLFGDEQKSIVVYNRIRDKLGLTPKS